MHNMLQKLIFGIKTKMEQLLFLYRDTYSS